MKLRNAMVLWNDNSSLTHQREIMVVEHGRNNHEYDYLYKSDCACMAGWKTSSDIDRIVHLFILFGRIILEAGISSDEVHKAFLSIDEYREWIITHGVNGNISNAYWGYSGLLQNVPSNSKQPRHAA